MKMKNYRFTYKQLVRPTYRIKNPFNLFDISNMDEVILIDDDKVYTRTIKAPNLVVAKALFAIDVCDQYCGMGFGRVIAANASMNIASIEKVPNE